MTREQLEELRKYATEELDGQQCVFVEQQLWFRILNLVEASIEYGARPLPSKILNLRQRIDELPG